MVKKDVRRIGLFVSWFQADEPEERSALSNEDSNREHAIVIFKEDCMIRYCIYV